MNGDEDLSKRFFVTGGTLKPGDPSYIQRPADNELWQHLRAGDYCYVLTPRQMGKSSLMARTAVRLREAGDLAAMVDLTQIGSGASTEAEAWFFGVVKEIHKGLGGAASLREWWQENNALPPVQRFVDYFQELALAEGEARIVVFVDEIDSTLKLPWAADFFAAIRACHNRRATEPAFEKLSFVLLGVATPNQLITDPKRTPFNVGQQIALTDFSPEEARPLAGGLRQDSEAGDSADQLLGKILAWTGGQPFLTQLLCRTVAERGADAQPVEIDELVSETLLTPKKLREEIHLKNIGDQLTAKPEARGRLLLYRRVLQGKKVLDQPAAPACSSLKLSGVVKVDGEGGLAVRNRVYEEVFSSAWVGRKIPSNQARQVALAAVVLLVVMGSLWLRFVQPRPYVEQLALALDDYQVAAEAHRQLLGNPLFPSEQADELMARFWERRALRSAGMEDRDRSLLEELQALRLADSEMRRRRVNELVEGFEGLIVTMRHAGSVTAVDFAPSGEKVLTGSENGTAHLWEAASGKPTGKTIWHRSPITALSFSPDSSVIGTGSPDGTVRLWNANTQEAIGEPIRHQDRLWELAFSDNSKAVMTQSINRTTRLWSAQDGQPIGKPIKRPVGTGLAGSRLNDQMTFAPSTRHRSRDPNERDSAFARLYQHGGQRQTEWAFSPNHRTILTGGGDGNARLWTFRAAAIASPLIANETSFSALAFSANGQSILTVDHNGTVQVWNTSTRKPIELPQNAGVRVTSGAISPDGKTVLLASNDGVAQLWNTSARAFVAQLQLKSSANMLAFRYDSKLALVGCLGGTLYIWETQTGRSEELGGLVGRVTTAAFSSDGTKIFTGDGYGIGQVRDASAGLPLGRSMLNHDIVTTGAFSSTGETLLAGTSDGYVRLWRLFPAYIRTGDPIQYPDTIVAVSFIPSSKPVLRWSSRYHELVFTPPAELGTGERALVRTKQWLHIYAVTQRGLEHLASRFASHGKLVGHIVPTDCNDCLDIAIQPTPNTLNIERIHYLEADAAAIQGDPTTLLREWQKKLALGFDKKMNIVPRYQVPTPPFGGNPNSPREGVADPSGGENQSSQ